ncbi:hypothetical protein VNI00_001374 [Paramarasmius palmivorus]|uniref:Major facilitator superfamily (MFS) profile domain-containing protein n=1 Tax=Paramarasmius palmivorus TaxID=297713 RepID=A0AAW0E5I6_9AGAR
MPNSHSDTESQTTLDRHIIQPEHPASATTTDLEKLPDQKEGKKRESSNVSVRVVDPRYETDDVTIVDWDIDDAENPRKRKKIIATCLVSALTFLTPLSSAMIAPAGTLIAEEFKITDDFVVNMITSVFVLAYAVGPLIIGPLSELFGRKYVGTIANIIYFGCGFARNTGQLIAFRFLSGIGGSAPFAVSGGVLGDIWTAEERGAANGLYTVGAVLGTGVGPVCGAWIAERTSWRWVVIIILLSYHRAITHEQDLVLGHKYTYAPTLLARRAAKIRVERGLPKGDLTLVRSKYENPDWKLGAFVWKSVIRPFELFIQEPIIQVIGAYMTFLYGVVYLVLTTIPNIFLVERGESLGISGLHYIAHIIGAVLAASFSMVTLDPLYRYLKGRKGGIGQPEYRIRG